MLCHVKACVWLIAPVLVHPCAADDMEEMVHAVKHALQQCCLQVCMALNPHTIPTL